MERYKQIARFLRKGKCWTRHFLGTECVRPTIAERTIKDLKPVIEGNRKQPLNPACSGCPRPTDNRPFPAQKLR